MYMKRRRRPWMTRTRSDGPPARQGRGRMAQAMPEGRRPWLWSPGQSSPRVAPTPPLTGVRKGPGWTQATLHQLLSEQLKGYRLLVVSNREPYSHVRAGSGTKVVQAVGGVVTALDPVMKAAEGTWIAQATGDLDAESSDASGRVAVPPGAPRYTLRRVFLTPEEEDGY